MRASDSKRKYGVDEDGGVPLTSLMDVMTIILLFLLQSFSADGNLIKKDESSELTQSQADRKAQNYATVIVTPGEIKLKIDVTKDPNPEWTTVYSAELINDSTTFTIANLLKGLEIKAKEIDEREKEMVLQQIDEGVIAEQVKRTVLIEVDKKVPYILVTKVLATCGEAGFSDMELLTYGK